ncbi:MALT1 paracaspase S homeolog isoform X3 [Xenopus laevis]|uniref:MALT1 paracaspase S homeolog isoform X3 n=1 Tax=Xenopus laevis TaxID=8355 RepID=A0A8J0TZX8_XENLA|nr:MALT1 paracaspase S homeolog isoform X3 [Xenopus laevis]
MSDSQQFNSLNVNSLQEPVLQKLCELLEQKSDKGWRKLAQAIASDSRFKISSQELHQCSLKVLMPEGSPARSLLKLMGDRGCTTKDLTEFLHGIGQLEAIQLLKPPGIKVIVQPESMAVLSGLMVKLSCVASGHPFVNYQWFRGHKEIPQGNSSELVFNPAHAHDAGSYICRVNNGYSYDFSVWAYLDVMESPLKSHEELTGLTISEIENEDFFAVDKVALLIGNMSYKHHPQLKAPMVDVYELTNLLRQLDFKVVSLLDLTELEMKSAVNEFLLLLDKGVYGLLYYAGHGYENDGNSFMVPIDAPRPYRYSDCLCVQNILKLMQEKETGLNVFLLDMCRKRNQYDDTILILESLKVTANIVFGYATCQGAEAFEIQHPDLADGIFMKFLKKRLLENMKITVLLDQVAEDMGKCQLTKGMQALEIRSSLSEKRALTDPIRQTACSPESLARNLQWAKAHELPESMAIEFDCGVKVKLGFAAEFSNVMIIYTRITEMPTEIIHCKANVTDFPVDLNVDPKETNKETPEETGSYLVSKELPKCGSYTRLSSLQTLKENLTFTVCLNYMYQGIEEMLDEIRKVDVGKPLIAKLDIHSGFKRNLSVQTLHSPCHSPELGLGVAEASHVCTNPLYSQSHFNAYHSSVRTATHPGTFPAEIYSGFSTANSRSRYFPEPIITYNVPEETTDDNNSYYTQ